jgi:integrase/recombinase XerD
MLPGRPLSTTPMQLSDAVPSFISYCQSERHAAATTIAKYQDCFRSWLLPWAADLEVKDITRLKVLELRKAMVAKKLSIARQYSVIMCLKSFLKFSRTVLSISCLDPTEVKLPHRPAPDVEYLTNDEVQRVLGAISIHTLTGARLRALVVLLLSTGLRISEALSLKREPFDLRQAELIVSGKGSYSRQVFLSTDCLFWVKHYLDKRTDSSPWLFVTTGLEPRPMKREDMSKHFKLLKRRAGITKKFTPHILRHTFCTNLNHHGADITHIRDLAGHHNIQTTVRYYLGKDPKVLRDVVEKCLNYDLPVDGLRPTTGQSV